MELYDLVRCLDHASAQQADLKKRMRRVAKKDKVVDVPLSKHELEKVVCFQSLISSCCVLWHCFAHNMQTIIYPLIAVCTGRYSVTQYISVQELKKAC